MQTDFLTMDEIETDVQETCKAIHKHVGTADDDSIMSMMEAVCGLAYELTRFSYETDEWACFDLCKHYRDGLKLVYDNLDSRLCNEN